MSDPLLRIDALAFAWPGDAPLLRDWSASIGPGVTQLYGDMGSGKTSLLRLLAGELAPTAGRLTLAGVAHDADARHYRAQVFYVDTASDRFDQLSGRACLAALAQGDHGVDIAYREKLVEGFGLSPHIDKPLYMLSTGSKRKVWLAAALACSRPLTLLDEPCAALDNGSRERLWQGLAQVAQRHDRAVVVASSEHIDAVPLAGSITLPLAG